MVWEMEFFSPLTTYNTKAWDDDEYFTAYSQTWLLEFTRRKNEGTKKGTNTTDSASGVHEEEKKGLFKSEFTFFSSQV